MAGTENKTVYQRLRNVQKALHAPKGVTGRFGKHRNVEGILLALKPHLDKEELTLILSNEPAEIGGRNYIVAIATVYDNEGRSISASSPAWEGDINRGLDAPQVSGSASSYARKYALGGLFAIDDTKDPDSNTDDPEPPKAATTPAKPVDKPKKDIDTVTDKEKRQLKNMMTALEMEPDAMGLMVESVLEKPKVETHGDFKKVVEALEESPDE